MINIGRIWLNCSDLVEVNCVNRINRRIQHVADFCLQLQNGTDGSRLSGIPGVSVDEHERDSSWPKVTKIPCDHTEIFQSLQSRSTLRIGEPHSTNFECDFQITERIFIKVYSILQITHPSP